MLSLNSFDIKKGISIHNRKLHIDSTSVSRLKMTAIMLNSNIENNKFYDFFVDWREEFIYQRIRDCLDK